MSRSLSSIVEVQVSLCANLDSSNQLQSIRLAYIDLTQKLPVMPAKVKVRILAGRNLPVMDKSSDASDAFVEVKLGTITYKTEVYRRSLNPFWNSEWFRFEVSDQELQDEPLQIRIMDYDTYSANDAIGKVYINLNPLLVNPGRSMSGWLPIYDTLHGIRGEINCMVKVNLFSDNNRYRQSSCGVRFFFSDIPNGYKCDAILGFVDELLVNDDPEYQWIDKIRTPRASNEARQTLFTKLSGEVQRKLGQKAEIFGGNAVIGYRQSFDLEGGSGIVGRGIGTAVVLNKIGSPFEGLISPMNLSNRGHLTFDRDIPYGEPPRAQRSSLHPTRNLVHSVSAE